MSKEKYLKRCLNRHKLHEQNKKREKKQRINLILRDGEPIMADWDERPRRSREIPTELGPMLMVGIMSHKLRGRGL